MIDYFLKGANKSLLAFRNFISIIKRMFILLMLAFILLNALWFYLNMNDYTRYLLVLNFKANVMDFMDIPYQGQYSSMQWQTPKGDLLTVHVKDYLKSPYYSESLKVTKAILKTGLFVSLFVVFIFLGLISLFFILKGRREAGKKRLRGSNIVTARELNRLLKSKKMKSDIPIGDSFLVKDTDIEHILAVGGMRQGKSVLIKWLVSHSNGKKIIFDITGEFISLFYRPEKDYILNPFDQRSQKWTIWAECDNELDVNARAESLIPAAHLVGEQKFWAGSAQNIFAAVVTALMQKGETNTETLLNLLFSIDLSKVQSLIKGTEAEVFTSDKVEKMAISIKSILNSHIKCLKYLDDRENKPLFSIKKWIQNESITDSILFISADEIQLQTLKPLISLQIDTAIQSLMTLTPDRSRRVRFYFDEIASLQYLPSLEGGMTRSPKYGGCFVLGAQSIAQFEKNYGSVSTDILFDACATKIYFRLSSVKTAKWAAADIGEEEIEEKRESTSVSAGIKHDGSISTNSQVRSNYPVSYTEIKNLNKLTAYLNLPGNWPVAKIKLKIFNKKPIALPFIAAQIKPHVIQSEIGDDLNDVTNISLPAIKIPAELNW